MCITVMVHQRNINHYNITTQLRSLLLLYGCAKNKRKNKLCTNKSDNNNDNNVCGGGGKKHALRCPGEGGTRNLFEQPELPALRLQLQPVHVFPEFLDFLLDLLYRVQFALDGHHVALHLGDLRLARLQRPCQLVQLRPDLGQRDAGLHVATVFGAVERDGRTRGHAARL